MSKARELLKLVEADDVFGTRTRKGQSVVVDFPKEIFKGDWEFSKIEGNKNQVYQNRLNTTGKFTLDSDDEFMVFKWEEGGSPMLFGQTGVSSVDLKGKKLVFKFQDGLKYTFMKA